MKIPLLFQRRPISRANELAALDALSAAASGPPHSPRTPRLAGEERRDRTAAGLRGDGVDTR